MAQYDFTVKDIIDPAVVTELEKLDTQFKNAKQSYSEFAKALASATKVNPNTLAELSAKTESLTKLNNSLSKSHEELIRVQSEYVKTLDSINQRIENLKKLDTLIKSMDNFTNSVNKASDILNKHASAQDKSATSAQRTTEVIQQASQATGLASQEYAAIIDSVKSFNSGAVGLSETLVEQKARLKDLQEEIKRVEKGAKDGSIEWANYTESIGKLTQEERLFKAEIKQTEDLLKSQATVSAQTSGSYYEMNAAMLQLEKRYKNLSAEERSGAIGSELVKDIDNLKTQLKELDSELGNYQRNVGNYESGTVKLTTAIRNNTYALAQMRMEGKENTTEYQRLQAETAKLRGELSNVTKEVQALSSNTSTLGSFTSGLTGLAGGFTAVTGAMTLFGGKSENVSEAQKKLQSVMAITMGLTALQTNLHKQSAAMLGITALQTAAAAKAEAYRRLIQIQGTNATIGATVAQRAFNLVARANPYVLLATAVLTVVGAFALFSKSGQAAAREQKRLNTEIERTNSELSRIKSEVDFDVAIAEASGASAMSLLELQREAAKTAYAVADSNYLMVLSSKNSTKEQIDNAKRLADDAWENLMSSNNRISVQVIKDNEQKKKDSEKYAKDQLKIERETAEERIKLISDERDRELSTLRNSYSVRLSEIKGYSKKENELRAVLAESQKKQEAEINQKYDNQIATSNLNNRLAFAEKGSNEELDIRLQMLEMQRQTELSEAEKLGIDKLSVEQKYNALIEQEREKHVEKNVRLAQEAAEKQVEALNDQMIREQISLNERYTSGQITKEEYERENLAIQQKYALESIQVAMDTLKSRLDVEGLLPAEREAIESEIAKLQMTYAKLASDYEVDAFNKSSDASKKLRENIAQALEYASQAVGEIGKLFSNLYQGRIEELEAQQEANEEAYNKEIETIESLVERGVISEEEGEVRKRYAEEQTAAKEAELAKKKADLQTKQAKLEKATNISQIIMNTAVGIMKAWGQLGAFGAPMAAIIGAMGAIQLATAVAQPIPKYAKGTDNHKGGLAIVGDGGKQELITTPKGEMFITPNVATLVDLPAGSTVMPDAFDPRVLRSDLSVLMNNRGANDKPIIINNYKVLEDKIEKSTKANIKGFNYLSRSILKTNKFNNIRGKL